MACQNKRNLFNLFMKLKMIYQRGTRRLLHLFATVLLCKFDSRNPYTSAIATQLIGKILSCLADSSIRCRLTTCNFWKLCITSTWKYGLPVHCVIHNSPQFRSEEFAHFMKVNGVKHVSFVSPIPEKCINPSHVRPQYWCEKKCRVRGSFFRKETLASASLYIMATPIETYKNIVSKVLENRIYETRATNICQEMIID